MISHKHKCIFIHIPKTAGTSINTFFHPGIIFKTLPPDYDRLFGWCPKRKIHLQHATSKQLLELELISEEVWKEYFKFTFVRNPWDRAYSDYLWMQKFSGVKASFKEYMFNEGAFKKILTDTSDHHYLGDHKISQSDFFSMEGPLKLDFVGRFENFNIDIKIILKNLGILTPFDSHENKGKRELNYSNFYTGSMKKWVEKSYERDITAFEYSFEDKRTGLNKFKKFL
jgi:hypothetical protein